jgi:hypothetical protein
MGIYRVEDWCRLASTVVEIHRNGRFIRTGHVDVATADSRMLWLSPHGVESRVLIDKFDGYEIWLKSKTP